MGLNALFADAVPAEWRGHVTGVRNAVLSVAFMVASLVSGAILERLPFLTGYQIVFTIGFVGAAISSFHLAFVRPLSDGRQQRRAWHRLGDLASPGGARSAIKGTRTSVGERFLAQRRMSLVRLESSPGLSGW